MKLVGVLTVFLAGIGCAEALQLEVETPLRRFSCSLPGSAAIEGSVVEAGPERFILDQCLPTQDCQKVVPAVFSVSAPGFTGFQKYLTKSGFVRVQFELRLIGQVCQQRVQVNSIGKWLGEPNPAGAGDRLYFASGTNTTATFPDSRFTIERCPQGRHLLRLRERTAQQHDAQPGKSMWRMSARELWTVNVTAAGSCSSDTNWSYWLADGAN